MKASIHPKWFPSASVSCITCGNSWTTGATVESITTEICSNCHPFYTGEQRIVDTEGRVDRFMERLRQRDQKIADEATRKSAMTPPDLPLSELGLSKRHLTILNENGVHVVQDVLSLLSDRGEEALLAFAGIGRQAVSDLKKGLRTRGYKLPGGSEEAEAAAE